MEAFSSNPIIFILICVALFAVSFLIQAFFAFKFKSRVVKCLPIIPAALLVGFCILATVYCIVVFTAPTVDGEGFEQLGQGLGKALVLVLTIAACVPCLCAIAGNASAWVIYAIVSLIRRKKTAALPQADADALFMPVDAVDEAAAEADTQPPVKKENIP